MSKVKYISGEWQSEVSAMAKLNEGGGASDSIATLIQDSFDIVTEAEASIQQYDSDGEIKVEFNVGQAGKYPPLTFPTLLTALHSYAKNAPTAVRNDIDLPFNMGLDDFLGAMSNADSSSYSTPGIGSLARTGVEGANQVASVSLSDLFQPQTVIGQALKREYIDMKNQVDGDFTYEDYVELSQNLASYSYDSFLEALVKGGVAFAVTAAVTSIPIIGPIISFGMAGYGAVDGFYGAVTGTEFLTGRELSGEEKVLKGLFGAFNLAMMGISAYTGLKQLKEYRAANKTAQPEKIVGPESSRGKYADRLDYLHDKYGKMTTSELHAEINRTELRRMLPDNSPSTAAQNWQGKNPYFGVDDYVDKMYPKGTTLYAGEPYPSGYFSTESAILDNGMDASKIFEGVQVRPFLGDGMEHAIYRDTMGAYQLNVNVVGANGIAKANPQFGKGGLEQIFMSDFQELLHNKYITRIPKGEIVLSNSKVSLDKFQAMEDMIEELELLSKLGGNK